MTATWAEREALLAAVLDAPDDDLPRLIYADWLEEYGDDLGLRRAHFIRAQIRYPEETDCEYELRGHAPRSERPSLLGRLIDREDVRRLLVDLMHGFPASDCVVTFRRGFVDEVNAPLATLLGHGAAAVKAHPVARMMATDREPCDRCGNHGYHWHYHHRSQMRSNLPDPLWHVHGDWPTAALALEALHSAVLRLCRLEAAR
jgi:uncharacterized protein (TIGR02996 family)